MAKKPLPSQAMKKLNTLNTVANKSKELKEEIMKVEDQNELPQEVRSNIIMLKDDMLLDDPYNKEIYGEDEVDALAEAMKQQGFRGVVLAYPYDGKYMIESGHRRREAARKAGIEEYPTFVTESPKAEWERRINLFMGNLHERKEKPMVTARVAQGLYDAHSERIKAAKAEGTLKDGENTNINEIVAEAMEVDTTTVELYRRLINLIPELQELADDSRYSWSAIAYASNMSAAYQKKLNDMIVEKTKKDGEDVVSRAWIKKTIQNLKLEEKTGEIAAVVPTKEKTTRIRRKNGTKTIMNCTKSLKEVLENDSIIKENEVEVVVKTLKELQSSIEKKLKELTK